MIGIIGIIVIFVMVFGGFMLAGGHLGIVLHAMPHEMITIGGAAVGAFVISNDMSTIKHTMKDIGKVFKGTKWKPADFRDLLCLLFELIRLARQNPVAIEEHIEAPNDSSIFGKYPRILKDHEAVELICDTLRSASMNYNDPHQVEEVLEKQLDANLAHALHGSHALQSVADALPALGIVAAVLGVIKTMGSIDQPPEILGEMIGSALVGTFLGVFLAYGFAGPFAQKVKSVVEEDSHFYKLIREVLVANLHNHATNICIEVGRQNTPHHIRPSFAELEGALKAIKQDAA
ncbi:flagellar motor stator protein MotA [Phaeovulum sp.]|uniref:flagellar motor stator protein MotA n=1 Tax=Phaeovulum sp. TaxID=2934796 RepID=UPI002731D984|nr:flagellar motor stator protein MotA [Phaeovulum sp.]MDP1669211.1 flagellar motor stator protein MotA [Phaeovulum sp.]MDZ4120501.1 flagellar motor stator protein MotA [Phaeovulum sp.]